MGGWVTDFRVLIADDHPMVRGALREAIKVTRAAGHKIKFLYLIPNYQNPAGVLLSPDRRTEILEICREAQIFVIEDNPYGLLGFDKPSPNAMRAEDSENVIYSSIRRRVDQDDDDLKKNGNTYAKPAMNKKK